MTFDDIIFRIIGCCYASVIVTGTIFILVIAIRGIKEVILKIWEGKNV